jgi:3-hydroxyacyl-[acyl-carrier-protein] dehydratase
MIGAAAIKDILPHRYPVLLVDRVTEVSPGRQLTAIKAVTVNEPYYQYLPPGADDAAHDYPMVLLIESWCQAAGLLAANVHPRDLAGRVPLLGGITDVSFSGRVRPGDVVEHRVELVRDFGDSLILAGESTVAGQVVMGVRRASIAIRAARVPEPAERMG